MSKELPYQRSSLPNRLQVVLYPMRSVRSVFAVIYVRVGAIWEKQNEKGISHFTEHASFLGTKSYPSAAKLSQAKENLGALLDARTSLFNSQYWIKVPHPNFEKGMNILSEIIFEPLLKEKNILKETEVVLSEFNDFWQNPDSRFEYESWRRRFAQKEHPYSFLILGAPQTIKKFNRKQVLFWRKKYYHPANMVLTIVGNLPHNTKTIIEQAFGSIKPGSKTKEPKFSSNDYSNFTIYHQPENRDQIRFIISFPAFGWKQISRRKRLALRLLNHILGGGPASRLFLRLREKERFVYSVGSEFYSYAWMGDIEIWGSVPAEKLIPAMKVIKKELDRLIKKGVSQKETKQAKGFLSSITLMNFDNPENIAYSLISQEFNGEEIWLPERIIEEAEKITEEEIEILVRKIFDYSKINISLLGKIPPEILKEVKKVFTI